MKHEAELVAVEPASMRLVAEVVFTADPELDASIEQHQSFLKRRMAALKGWVNRRMHVDPCCTAYRSSFLSGGM